MKTYTVLSIEAWNSPDGWTWNQWFNVGTVELKTLDSVRHVLRAMRDAGYLSDKSKGRVYIDDLVIRDSGTHEPLFVIEYGSELI